MASIFQKFSKRFLRDLKSEFNFVHPLESALAPALPKASTFYLGRSPTFGKHVFLNLQHSPKPWDSGMFTVNVAIASQFGLPERWNVRDDEFQTFEDGFYRLGTTTGPTDVWWCLSPDDKGNSRESTKYFEYWNPSTFDDESIVLAECSSSVRAFLIERLLVRGGFVAATV